MAKKQAKTKTEPWDSAHKIWLAGLGALSAAGEEGEKLFRTLIERGEKYEERVGEPVRKVRGQVSRARNRASKTLEEIESAFDDRVGSVLGRLGVPSRDEIARLTRKVERLTRAVEGKATNGTGKTRRKTKKKAAAARTTRKSPSKKTARKRTS